MEVSELVYNDNVEIKYDTLFDMGKRSVAQDVVMESYMDEDGAEYFYEKDNSSVANFRQLDERSDIGRGSVADSRQINDIPISNTVEEDEAENTITNKTISVSENGTLSVSDTTSAVATTTESDAKQAAAVQAATQALKTQYNSSSGSRLVKFDYTTGDDDSQRRAYFMIKGGETDLSALKKTIAAETGIEAIFKLFTVGTGFINFILTGLSENLQEKQSIMPTIGDHFAATFSGQDPQVMSINGLLPFDANSEQASWYMNFLKAYNFIFRASILARYKLQLVLCVPDMATYICYPISFTSNIMSQNDNVIQFTMGAIVANKGIVGAYGLNPDITKALTVQEEVSNLNQESAKAKAEGKNVTPDKDGKKSSKITFLDKAAKAVQDTLQGKNDIGRAIQDVNKVVSSIKQVSGAVELVTGKSLLPAGIRKGLKIFSK